MAGESIIFEIGGDNSNFVREMGRTKEYARSSSAAIDKELSNIGKGARIGEVFTKGAVAAGSLVAGVAVATAAMEKLLGVADKFGHIQDLSDRTGLSPEFLQAIGRAADQSGTSVDAVAKAVSKFARELTNASSGDDFTKKLDALGLNVEELRGLRPEEIFGKMATAVAGISDPTARSAAAMDVFGRSAAELIPIMGSVGDALNTVDVLSAEQVARLDEMGDAWAELGADLSTTAGALLSDVAPAITESIKLIRELIASYRALGMVVEGLASGQSFGDAFDAADNFYSKKIDEINNPPAPTPKPDIDSDGGDPAGSSSGASASRGAGSGTGAPSKPDLAKTPEERVWDEYKSDPKNMQGGRFRTPAEARRIERDAQESRDRADRWNSRAFGGSSRQSPQGHPTANNLAQARGFYGGDVSEGGFGLNRSPKNHYSAQDLAESRHFYGGGKASDQEIQGIIENSRAKAENGHAAAQKAASDDSSKGGSSSSSTGSPIGDILKILQGWDR